MSASNYANTWRLSRFIGRRNRIWIPVWLLALMMFTVAIAAAFTNLYPTEQDRQIAAETMTNPAVIAMLGPGYGLDGDPTLGALFAFEMLVFTAIAVGIMNILFVARHTRSDEEEGRLELLRSLPTGRLSVLNATVCSSVVVNVILAVATGLALAALGIESMNLAGSLIYGAALGATGILFAAVTAVFAQLTVTSRGTIGFSIAILILSYFIRAVGDVGNEALSWVSPLSWVLKSEAYVSNLWWPILLTLGAALILIVLAFRLNAIRDLEAGFIPAKPGRRRASVFLQSPLGLAFRIQRTGLIAWAVCMVVLGASYGSIMGDLDAYLSNNELLAKMFTAEAGYSLTEQFITVLMKVITMICTIPPLMAVLKLKGEERRNRTEHLLARAVSRNRLLGSYAVVSVISAFVMVSLSAVSLGAVGSSVMEEAIPLGTIYGAAVAYLPAMLVLIGLAVLLIGLAPKLTGLTWLYLTYSFFVLYIGSMLQLPEWTGKLSPFGHVPQIPIEEMRFAELAVQLLIAAILTGIGFIGYKRRDIQG